MKKLFLLALLALVSCTSNETPRPSASPSGPPQIQTDALDAHAEEFTQDLSGREAGSQEEFAAATYITAHLQQAGYVVEFDSVPVANTVRSTNVVALPPSTEDPEYLVAVAYDSGGDPGAIGAFLELARALRAADPDHSVQFVALGAESAQVEGGTLGSRRMIRLLQDRELDPEVLVLTAKQHPSWPLLKAYGSSAGDLIQLSFEMHCPECNGVTDELLTDPTNEAFAAAKLDTTLVVGRPDRTGPVLLRFLTQESG